MRVEHLIRSPWKSNAPRLRFKWYNNSFRTLLTARRNRVQAVFMGKWIQDIAHIHKQRKPHILHLLSDCIYEDMDREAEAGLDPLEQEVVALTGFECCCRILFCFSI